MKKIVLIFSLLLLSTSCLDESEYRITNVEIYRNTPAWELAKAVNSQDTGNIARIAEKNPELLNYKEPRFDKSLLMWAVDMEKYEAAEALLKAGANPNVRTAFGMTALYSAASYSRIDKDFKADPKFVKLLLDYGADPNLGEHGDEGYPSPVIGTPLMRSIGCGIEKTKALVEAGADINFRTSSGDSAVVQALWTGESTFFWNHGPEYAYYLIVEKKADVTKPRLRRTSGEEVPLVTYLRNWVYPLDSEEHRMKMEIVEEFARQGEDYRATRLNREARDRVMSLYPDTWREYVMKY